MRQMWMVLVVVLGCGSATDDTESDGPQASATNATSGTETLVEESHETPAAEPIAFELSGDVPEVIAEWRGVQAWVLDHEEGEGRRWFRVLPESIESCRDAYDPPEGTRWFEVYATYGAGQTTSADDMGSGGFATADGQETAGGGSATVIDAPTEVGATARVRVEGYSIIDFRDDEGTFEVSTEFAAEVCPAYSQLPR